MCVIVKLQTFSRVYVMLLENTLLYREIRSKRARKREARL